MPEITLKIPCEDYLAQWYVNESGGSSPVKLRKNSPEQHLLRCLLVSKNSLAAAVHSGSVASGNDDIRNSLEIIIPYFKGMPPEIYNHISARGQRVFTDALRKRFDLRLFDDLAPIIDFVDRRDELIWAWMEANGIEPTDKNWSAVEKRLRRLIDRMKTKIRVREFRRKRSNKK